MPGGNALYNAINTFLANPGAAASALGLTRVKRDVEEDDAFHFQAVGIEVDFVYHNKDHPQEGGNLSLSAEESVLAKVFPDLQKWFCLGQVKLSMDLRNEGRAHNPNFRLGIKYDNIHRIHNEKAVFTIFRHIDKKTKKIHSSINLENIRNFRKSHLIQNFLLHTDELTFVEGKFTGHNGIDHQLKAELNIENKNVLMNTNLGQSLKIDWAASNDEWIKLKATFILGSNAQYDIDFHFQKRAYPSFGLTVSTGTKALFVFETKSVVEPNIIYPEDVKYELRYKAMHIGDGKFRFSWNSEKYNPQTGDILVKKHLKIQYLPKTGLDMKIIITPERISGGEKYTTEITQSGKPYLNNVIVTTKTYQPIIKEKKEITTETPYNNYGMYNTQSVEYSKTKKFNLSTEIFNKNLQQRLRYSTKKIQGEITDTPFNLYLEVTNDNERKILYKVNFGNFPDGMIIEITDPYFLSIFLSFTPMYIGLCGTPIGCLDSLKLSTEIDITPPYSTSRMFSLLVKNQDDSVSNILAGAMDIDTGSGLYKFHLSNNFSFLRRPGDRFTNIQDITVDMISSKSDAKIKMVYSPDPSAANYVVELNGNKLLTDASLYVNNGGTNLVSLALKGSDLSIKAIEYLLIYHITGLEEGKVNLSWILEEKQIGIKGIIKVHYLPTGKPDILTVITLGKTVKGMENAYRLNTSITLKGQPLFDEKLAVNFKQGTIEYSYKCNDYQHNFQDVFEILEVYGNIEPQYDLLKSKLEAKVVIDEDHDKIAEYKINHLEMPYGVDIKDPYLLPEIYKLANLPRKETLKIVIVEETDPKVKILKETGSGNLFILLGANKYELWQADEMLFMLGYDGSSAEVGILVLPGDQNLCAKVSWKFGVEGEYELKISGLETHNIKITEDYSKDYSFKLEAKGDNYWLGKYDITREGVFKEDNNQLKGGWTGATSIENAPFPTPVHTEVDFDFPYRKKYSYGYYPPPSYYPPPPPPPQGYGPTGKEFVEHKRPPVVSTQVTHRSPTSEQRNYILNISMKALGTKFTFGFNNGRISLDF